MDEYFKIESTSLKYVWDYDQLIPGLLGGWLGLGLGPGLG